jgi:hypothetical protein
MTLDNAISGDIRCPETILFEDDMTRLTPFKFFKFSASIVLMSVVVPMFFGPMSFVPFAVAQDNRSAQQQACSRDVSRNCRKQMNDGDLAIYQCLQQNQNKLSPACRKVVGGS